MSGSLRMRRKGLVLCTILGALLTAALGFWLMHRLQAGTVSSVHEELKGWQPVLAALRWFAILVVGAGWNHWVALLVRIRRLDPARAERLIGLRWRIVAWMVALELVLGQGALVRIVQLATGTGS